MGKWKILIGDLMKKEMEDHDLLITINTKLTQLCHQFRETRQENKDAHDKIWNHLNKGLERKLTAKIFWWVMPFIILGIISVATLASNNHYSIGKIEKSIEMHIGINEPKQLNANDINKQIKNSIIKQQGE